MVFTGSNREIKFLKDSFSYRSTVRHSEPKRKVFGIGQPRDTQNQKGRFFTGGKSRKHRPPEPKRKVFHTYKILSGEERRGGERERRRGSISVPGVPVIIN